MQQRTVIREDRLGMWTVTYGDGSQQHFNSEADARDAVRQDGRDAGVVVERYEPDGEDTAR